VDIDRFEVGLTYDVGNTVGAVFLAEKWAVPVAADASALMTPVNDPMSAELDRRHSRGVTDRGAAEAADSRRKRHKKRK